MPEIPCEIGGNRQALAKSFTDPGALIAEALQAFREDPIAAVR